MVREVPPNRCLYIIRGEDKIYSHHSEQISAIYIFFLICHYLELFLSFVSVIRLFARKYVLQQMLVSEQFSSTSSTRRIDEKMA